MRLELVLAAAVKQAGRRSGRGRFEAAILGKSGHDAFEGAIGEAAHYLPDFLTREYGEGVVPPSELLKRQFRRALHDVVAASENDEVARRILEANGPTSETRGNWRVLTATISTAAVIAAGLAAHAAGANTAEVAATGLAILSIEAAGFAYLAGRVGSQARTVHGALYEFLSALISPNRKWDACSVEDALSTRAVAPIITAELERLIGGAGSSGNHDPPFKEMVYRYEKSDLANIQQAGLRLATSVQALHLPPDSPLPHELARSIDQFLTFTRCSQPGSSIDDEHQLGELLLQVLLHSWALAKELDDAILGPNVRKATFTGDIAATATKTRSDSPSHRSQESHAQAAQSQREPERAALSSEDRPEAVC
jgi:hypothetical protein